MAFQEIIQHFGKKYYQHVGSGGYLIMNISKMPKWYFSQTLQSKIHCITGFEKSKQIFTVTYEEGVMFAFGI